MQAKKNAAFITASKRNFNYVYDADMQNTIKTAFSVETPLLSKAYLKKNPEAAKHVEFLFSTWGMEHFKKEEIQTYFPSLQCIFYAAGSVQDFAQPFLESGVRVFSAWKANAVPVAEYTYAQILLATKGFYRAAKRCRFDYLGANNYSKACGGNYKAKIGILGVGSIGGMVAEKLKANDVEVFYYDPFLPKERAEALGISEASLPEIFQNCDVITNHLANKEELSGVLNADLFNRMKPYATFINTGRGRQVNETDLYKAMRKVKTRTALLDVTYPEPKMPFHKLHRCKNIILTPHIAGSNGREVVRMAQYMKDEALRVANGEAVLYEVTEEMLKTMA